MYFKMFQNKRKIQKKYIVCHCGIAHFLMHVLIFDTHLPYFGSIVIIMRKNLFRNHSNSPTSAHRWLIGPQSTALT